MAEVIEESDDEDSYDDEYEHDDEEDEEEDEARRREANEPRILGGLRWLFNRANNEDTIVYENEDDEVEHEFGEDDYVLHVRPSTPDTPPPQRPSVEFITKKLVEQGVTMGDILKVLLLDHEEYESMEDELNRVEDDLFGKLRILISNYEPEQEVKTELLLTRTDDVTSYYNNRFIRVV
jgi:hypothetical protein